MICCAMQKTRTFEAVLFDIDGTLLDTTELLFQSFEHTLLQHNVDAKTREEIGKLIGRYIGEIYENLAPGLPTEQLIDTHFNFQMQHLHLAKLFPNTVAVLETLKKNNVKIGALTNRIKTSRPSLTLAGLDKYMDIIITAEELTHPKPHPEGIEKAIRNLHVERNDVVMVGDTKSDILFGKNAGVATIAATYGFHGKNLEKENPDYLIDDIADILPIIFTE